MSAASVGQRSRRVNATARAFAEAGVRMQEWRDALFAVKLLGDVVKDPGSTMVCAVDMIKGFCDEGSLASERVGALRDPIRQLFEKSNALNVRNLVLIQDAHSWNAAEFNDFPPHCERGSVEGETVDALASLPFYERIWKFSKNSISPALSHDNEARQWFKEFIDSELPCLNTIIVTGNCTDLCVYQLAMYFKTMANHYNYQVRIVVPANCVQTYDMSYEVADSLGAYGLGAYGHPGDFWHLVALYHMALNGIDVVREIQYNY